MGAHVWIKCVLNKKGYRLIIIGFESNIITSTIVVTVYLEIEFKYIFSQRKWSL